MRGIKIERRRNLCVRATLAVIGGLLIGGAAHAATIFSDNFSTSTLNGASTPSGGNMTSYDIAASKNQSPASSINPGDLKFGLAGTTSGLEEAQAVFASTPVSLVNPGDSIEMLLTFTDTGINVTGSTTSGQLDFGLYNSGGSAPKTDLAQSGLTNATTTDATGGAQLWQGYIAQLFFPTTSSKIVTRPQQNGAGATGNNNQDLIGNGFSSTNAFDNPAGAQIGSSSAASATLTTATTYTEDLVMSLNSSGSLTISSNLFSGTTNAGTPVSSMSSTASGANILTTSFDSLAFGYRGTAGTSVATGMDVSSLTINSPAVVTPEPVSLGALGVASLALIRRRRIA